MNVLFNRATQMVVGLNRPARPFEFEVVLEGTPQLSKTIQEVHGQVQKKNDVGQPLYKDNVMVGELGQETFEEVTESRKAISFEDQTFTYRTVDEEGNETPITGTSQVPTAFEDLEPVMVDNVVHGSVSFEANPMHFHHDEVVGAPVKLSIEDELRKENLELKLTTADNFEASEARKLELQIAIADLYETILV